MKMYQLLLVIIFCCPNIVFGQEIGSKTELKQLTNGDYYLQSPISLAENNIFKIEFDKDGVRFLEKEGVLKMLNGSTNNSITYANPIKVFGGGGDDLLIIDFENIQEPIEVIFDGQNNFTGTIGDALQLENGNFEEVTYHFFNEHDGLIELENHTVEYKGLEPISSVINSSSVTLNYSTTTETIDITDAGSGQITVNSNVGGEMVTFNVPSNSFTINTGDTGDDVLNVNSLSSSLSTSVNISFDGGTGNNTLVIDAQGGTYIDNGTSVQIIGSYTFNYVNFNTVNVVNGVLAPPSPEVPTLSEWGLLILALSLMTFGTVYLLQSKSESQIER